MKFIDQTRLKVSNSIHRIRQTLPGNELPRISWCNKRKLLMRMKLTSALMLTLFLQVGLAALAQKVTFTKGNASLENVLREINRQTGYKFLYTEEMMRETKPVNVNLKNAPIQEALDQCFIDQRLDLNDNNRSDCT